MTDAHKPKDGSLLPDGSSGAEETATGDSAGAQGAQARNVVHHADGESGNHKAVERSSAWETLRQVAAGVGKGGPCTRASSCSALPLSCLTAVLKVRC